MSLNKINKSINDISILTYNKPVRNDMVIGFVFFNIAKSNRLLMNYLYTTNKLKLANIPYYTLEVVYNKPEIPEAIHIACKSIMFQKERLCYVLEKHIPEKMNSKNIYIFVKSLVVHKEKSIAMKKKIQIYPISHNCIKSF